MQSKLSLRYGPVTRGWMRARKFSSCVLSFVSYRGCTECVQDAMNFNHVMHRQSMALPCVALVVEYFLAYSQCRTDSKKRLKKALRAPWPRLIIAVAGPHSCTHTHTLSEQTSAPSNPPQPPKARIDRMAVTVPCNSRHPSRVCLYSRRACFSPGPSKYTHRARYVVLTCRTWGGYVGILYYYVQTVTNRMTKAKAEGVYFLLLQQCKQCCRCFDERPSSSTYIGTQQRLEGLDIAQYCVF